MQFDVTNQEADVVLNALAAQPYNQVAMLITKLMQQVRDQQNPPVEPPTTP